MRGVLALIAVVVLLLIAGVATGFISIGQTREAKLPKVEGGQLPKFDADVGDLDVGTKNETIKVPTIDVDTARTDAKEDKDK